MFESSRRSFLKITGAACAALAGAKLLQPNAAQAQAPKAGAPANLVMVSESEPLAKSLGYHADASKVDNKAWPKHAGAEGAKQFCYNCQFYQTKEADPKATKAAPCTIFANKGVAAKGWCNSWTQNPKVKG